MKNLPFWLPRKKNLVWFLLFIGLFFLSLDFWAWNASKPLIFGLPFWMLNLLVLTLSLSFVFYIFIHFYWSEKE